MMSFELTNVSTTCQKIINDALRQHLNQFVIAYLNNIIIYLKILKEYVSHVFKVLECLNKRNLHLKLKKCEFHQKEINFLEFVVRRYEVRINSKKLRAIKE
jgi:amino acid permease